MNAQKAAPRRETPRLTDEAQGDLFAPDCSRLLGNDELIRLFNRLNVKYFAGELPPVRVEWSSRLRIAGNCRPDHHQIRLSVHYHTHYPEEIESTLIHEMLHLLYPTHNSDFRRAAEKFGVSVHCREYPGLHPRSRYIYVCPGCRTVYCREKRADMSCGKCSGERYDPRYRLVLTKTPARGRGRRVSRGR